VVQKIHIFEIIKPLVVTIECGKENTSLCFEDVFKTELHKRKQRLNALLFSSSSCGCCCSSWGYSRRKKRERGES
jgi:hypothetical protein